jgi:hypothetical protein
LGPIVVASVYRRSWALVCLLVSVPFTALELFYAVSHSFSFPEVALMALLVSQLLHVWREQELLVPMSPPVYLLVGFVIVCSISVMHLLVDPLDAMTHTYNTGSLDAFVLDPIGFSVTNVTQLLLRVFAIGAIVGLATVLTHYDVQRVLRVLIVCSLLIGVFGVLYQVTQKIDVNGIWELANAFGLDIQEKSGGILGFLPRMWTPIGEPGHTASYFLYLFSLTATLSFLPETRVASRKRLRIATAALFAVLLLSTSATAYGGLLVFGAVFLAATVVSRRIATRSVVAVCGTLLLSTLLLGGVIGVVASLDVIALLEPQLAKLQFKTGSGTLRLRYIEMAFDLFPQRPLFGAGVGSYYGASLLGTLLAEIGVIGFAAFVLAHVSAYWECLRASRDRIDGQGSVAIALVVSSVVLLGSSLLAKSISTLMFPWFWLSLALPIALSLQSTGRSVSFDRIRQRYGHLTWWDRTQPDR